MKVLILHASTKDDAAENAIHGMLCEALEAKGWETETKPLAQMRVAPCAGVSTAGSSPPANAPSTTTGGKW